MAEQESAAVVGLSHDPFAEPGLEYFDRGERKIYLEQLRNPAQWPRQLMLVTGPGQVGKTMLYRQLSASLEPRAKAARIGAALTSSATEVLAAIVQGFGIAVPAGASAETIREHIVEHATRQQASQRQCVTLIDDAELLEPRALAQLLELADRSPLRLALFGDVRLVNAVRREADPLGVEWHELRLNRLQPDDIIAYLQWRFRQAGHTGELPFSDVQIANITHTSEGLPGRIDQLASALLGRMLSNEPRGWPDYLRSLSLPSRHRTLLVLLAAVLLLAYAFWDSGEDAADPRAVRHEALPLPIDRSRPAEPASGPPTVPDPVREPDIGRAAEAGPDTEPAPAGDAAAGSITGPEPLPGAPAERPAPQEQSAPQERPAVTDRSAPAERPALPERPAATEQPAPVERPVPAEPPAAAEAPPVSGQPPIEERSTVAAALPKGVNWIMDQPQDAFTLQLVTLSTAARAAAYLESQADPAQFASYRLQRDGQVLHVVIFGSYVSRAEAEAAAARLPASVGRVTPWVRTFGQVQDAVRTALQQD